jgi:uncharacterized protein YaiL (DUF2058 family)
MGLSLRDQLLQAGFTQSKPEPKPEVRRDLPTSRRHGGPSSSQRRDNRAGPPQARKPDASARPPRAPGSVESRAGEPSLAHAYQIRAETEKREREEAQKRAQEEAARKREQRVKLAALVAGKAQNDREAEHVRNFSYGKKIRKVNVTPEQFRQLNAGELGVAQVDGRFMILSPELIREVLVLAPQHVALFVPEGIGASANPDEDYSDPRFQVPDDLVW